MQAAVPGIVAAKGVKRHSCRPREGEVKILFMPLLQTVIRTRRTVHRYRAGEVDAAALSRALECAQWAPNHKLTFPWRFTIVGAKTRVPLTELGMAIKDRPDLSEAMRLKVRDKLETPGALIVASLRTDAGDPVRAEEDYASVCCSVQLLMLSLWSEGIGSKWSTGKLTQHPATYQILEIPTASEKIIGFIWAGIPAELPEPPARPPLESISRWLP